MCGVKADVGCCGVWRSVVGRLWRAGGGSCGQGNADGLFDGDARRPADGELDEGRAHNLRTRAHEPAAREPTAGAGMENLLRPVDAYGYRTPQFAVCAAAWIGDAYRPRSQARGRRTERYQRGGFPLYTRRVLVFPQLSARPRRRGDADADCERDASGAHRYDGRLRRESHASLRLRGTLPVDLHAEDLCR